MRSIEIGLRHGIGLKRAKLFRMAVKGKSVNAEALAWERIRLADKVLLGTAGPQWAAAAATAAGGCRAGGVVVNG